ncbi:MAG: AAA family ATPase, partial [Acidimicrobiales bacterium]|nr:AAA family ATPase [Acidimicrobiales bacterium]
MLSDRRSDISNVIKIPRTEVHSQDLNETLLDGIVSECNIQYPDIVGRAPEKQLLQDALHTIASTGSGISVLIGGESGTGKTALAEWCLADAVLKNNFLMVRATCEPFHIGMSFFAIQELNRKLVGANSSVQQLIANIYGANSNEYLAANGIFDDKIDPALRREYIMATFVNVVVAKARATSRSIAIFLDDVERIDTPSVDALTVLLSRLDEEKILLLAAFRTDIVLGTKDHNFHSILDRARRSNSNIKFLEISSISHDDFPSLVHSFVNTNKSIPEQFLRRLYSETEGNPLHVREIIHSLLVLPSNQDAARIKQNMDGSWDFTNFSEIWSLPQSIEDAISDRLKGLSDTEMRVLETASVVGRSCSIKMLIKLTEMSENELLDVLDSLIEHDLLKEMLNSQDQMEFVHGKVRDVVYSQLTGLRRTRLHSQVAELLETLRSDFEDDEWEIAIGWHLFKARNYDSAAHHLIRSGQQSLSKQAAQEAAVHFRNALESLEK